MKRFLLFPLLILGFLTCTIHLPMIAYTFNGPLLSHWLNFQSGYNQTGDDSCFAKRPQNLFLTNETGCDATLHWSPVENAIFYVVKYKQLSDNQWIVLPNTITDTSYTFKGLTPNTKFLFAVASACSMNTKSVFEKIAGLESSCSFPPGVSATINSPTSITFSWLGCGLSNNNQVRYRAVCDLHWIYVLTGSEQTATITVSDTTPVIFQATSCIDTTGKWSPPDTVHVNFQLHKPNAIVILLDDARYDTYSCNEGPAFFQSPSIDRIANEGANFKKSFVDFSLCNPSRASTLTGLYPNHNGAVNNKTMFYYSLPTIATVLNSAQYYTAFMGKYLNANAEDPQPQAGWDYWLARVGSGHQDADFNYNGTEKNIVGHLTDVLTDSAMMVINRASEPFLIFISYVTHPPYVPRVEDAYLFDKTDIPLPDNFYPYQNNYPDFLADPYFMSDDSATITEDIRNYYKVLAGVDESLGRILSVLQNKNILDSTLILFTSDNGYLMGEHYLEGKRLPYEESMRVPMFIRYPKWFPANSISSNQMVLNVDIAPTLFDLAEVPNTIQSDGLSMHKIFNGTANRTSFYYVATNLNDSSVNCRSVRSLQYKYNYYYCDQGAEEFFDLVKDPEENTNLINDDAHQVLIQQYREKKDSFKMALNDNLIEDVSQCYIANPVYTCCRDTEVIAGITFYLFPNPSPGNIQLDIPISDNSATAEITIYSMSGNEVFKKNDLLLVKDTSVPLNLTDFKDGLYEVQVRLEDQVMNRKLVIVR